MGHKIIHTGEGFMYKMILAFITCTTAFTLLAGCGSAAGTGGEGSGVTAKSGDTKEVTEDITVDIKDDIAEDITEDITEVVADYQDTDGEMVLIDRPDPTIEVSAEEFQDRMGYSFCVPDGAQDVYYFINTDTNVGMMDFTLDGVTCIAQVLQRDIYIRLDHPYIDDSGVEISCGFENDPAMKVHGADPEIKAYRVRYSDDRIEYIYSANWFLDQEAYSISLRCHADAPIDSMPVEIFQ